MEEQDPKNNIFFPETPPSPGALNPNVVGSPISVTKTTLILPNVKRPAIQVSLSLNQQNAQAWGLAKATIDANTAGMWHLPGGPDPGQSNPSHGSGVAFGIGKSTSTTWYVHRPVIAFTFAPDQHGTINFTIRLQDFHWHFMHFVQTNGYFNIDSNGQIVISVQF